MSLNNLSSVFDNEYCSGSVVFMTKIDIVVSMKFKSMFQGKMVMYWAAAPANFGISLSGSGLPFANAIQAFESTPNKGLLQVSNDNTLTIEMKYPNAYYVGLGSLYVIPHLNMKVLANPDGMPSENDLSITIPIDNGIPFRTLTYPSPPSMLPRNSAEFYRGRPYLARSQEAILRASEYPANHEMPNDFWGERPPR